ncbi:EF-hand calcium-binding domain [Carpediemonas membranifera]|uniref:EF-hand calcium-binding domain n=1 Tax=Carpediemonas membranifera TaxID=201153 RepID=A0A8J6E0B9_9EUKA|nr:EF-hand calcium-binding domain [Carpediemonas membranifera]|eukprot:KAG9391616.1 EF-hand calcium-binding domain [Carpediemonas membranifera]
MNGEESNIEDVKEAEEASPVKQQPSIDDELFKQYYERGMAHVKPTMDLLPQLFAIRGLENPNDAKTIIAEMKERVQQLTRRFSLNAIALGAPELAEIELASLKADVANSVGSVASDLLASRNYPRLGEWVQKLTTSLTGAVHDIGAGVFNMYESLEAKNRALQAKLDARGTELTKLLAASDQLMQETTTHEENRTQMQRNHANQIAMLNEEINWLKSQNEKLKGLVRGNRYPPTPHRRNASSASSLSLRYGSEPGTPTQHPSTPEAGKGRGFSATAGSTSSPGAGSYASGQPGRFPSGLRTQAGPASGSHTPSRGQKEAGHVASGTNEPGQVKELTLRQTKDLISEIYESKKRYDSRVSTGGVPPETMEQHVNTYLNHRYGLRQLVLDWAASIRQAIAQHESADLDVAVFARIMRNEIDEQFKTVLDDLKSTVKELLRALIAQKLNTKPGTDAVSARLSQKMKGLLTKEEWTSIVKYLYRAEDVPAIVEGVITILGNRPRGKTGGAAVLSSDGRVPFPVFVRALLDFQLQGHDRFLQTIRRVFRQYDTDQNGVLTRFEFTELFRTLVGGGDTLDLDAAVEQADPWQQDMVTFSTTVAVLAGRLMALD